MSLCLSLLINASNENWSVSTISACIKIRRYDLHARSCAKGYQRSNDPKIPRPKYISLPSSHLQQAHSSLTYMIHQSPIALSYAFELLYICNLPAFESPPIISLFPIGPTVPLISRGDPTQSLLLAVHYYSTCSLSHRTREKLRYPKTGKVVGHTLD